MSNTSFAIELCEYIQYKIIQTLHDHNNYEYINTHTQHKMVHVLYKKQQQTNTYTTSKVYRRMLNAAVTKKVIIIFGTMDIF